MLDNPNRTRLKRARVERVRVKRKRVICLVLILLVALAACTPALKSGPSLTVAAYLDAVRDLDVVGGNVHLAHPTVEGDWLLSGRESQLPSDDEELLALFVTSLTKIWQEMTYRVKGSEITGDRAVVAVEITIADLSTLEGQLTSVAFDSMNQVPETQDRLITEVVIQALETAAAATRSQHITHTVRLDLKQVDGEWKILDHKLIGKAVIGNISGLLLPS